MITLDNFDWSATNRELVIFMPNWGRADYIRKTVLEIKTVIPKDKWIVLIINDRIHEDLSDIKSKNVVYFTFGPEREKEGRGDAFMRNIAIKRCQSKWLFQKDPEIIVTGDFIQNILRCPTNMYRLSGPARNTRQATTERFMRGEATVSECSKDASQHHIDPSKFVYYHFGFAVKTAILRDMRGYDEDYKEMYCADKDLYARLMAQGVKPTMDQQCKPIHLWHTKPWYPNTPETKANYAEMRALFDSKNPKCVVRNCPDTWGNGD